MVKVITKTCSTCHACKPVALFRKKRNQCKACIAAQKREYKQENKEEIAAQNREYRQENKEEIAAQKRKHGQEHREEIAAYNRKYGQEHKEEILAQRRKRYAKDPAYAMSKRLRTRMGKAVRAAGLGKKCASSSKLLGISYQGLKEWLEAQFTEGMTWENRSDWHVDHIVPCTAFDLLVEQNQHICFWYKNLQPLWGPDNLQKSNTYMEKEKQALISAYYNQ